MGKKLNGTLLGNAPVGGMAPCDWMLLSAMQDQSNWWFDYNGREASSFREGETDHALRTIMTDWTLLSDTSEIPTTIAGTDVDEWAAEKVSDLLRAHGNDVCVVMSVDSTTLQNETARDEHDHFVRLLRPLDYGPDNVKFEIFTWGSKRTKTFKKENFNHMVDAYIVGARRGIT